MTAGGGRLRLEGRAAGGECRAARPAAARRAVRARDRDRNGSDRGGPRVVLLLAGRAARGDRPARHEPADRRGRTELHRGRGEAAPRSAGADHAPGRRPTGGPHRPDEGREGLPELDDPGGQHRWPPGAGHQPEPAVRAQHRRRTRQLAQRGHRPRAGRGARLGRRATAGHRPGPPRSADLAGRPVVQRRGHPEALAAGARHRQQRLDRLPGRPEVPRLRQHGPAASRRPARRARSTCAPPPVTRRRCSRCSRRPPTPRHRTR